MFHSKKFFGIVSMAIFPPCLLTYDEAGLLSVVSFSLFYSLKKRELQCRKELKLIFCQ